MRETFGIIIPNPLTPLEKFAHRAICFQVGRARNIATITATLDRVKLCPVLLPNEKRPKTGERIPFDFVGDAVDGGKFSNEIRTDCQCERKTGVARRD